MKFSKDQGGVYHDNGRRGGGKDIKRTLKTKLETKTDENQGWKT